MLNLQVKGGEEGGKLKGVSGNGGKFCMLVECGTLKLELQSETGHVHEILMSKMGERSLPISVSLIRPET